MRKENSHQSEMVSQLLYGECYKLIEKRKKWVKIRGEWDGYEGWIDHNQVHIISQEDFDKITQSNLKISTDLVNYISTKNNLLFPILMGADLRALKILEHQFEGKYQYPKKSKVADLIAYICFVMGIDCSGFTQIVYKINGIRLSRDAHQQALQGQTLSFIEESEAGDLAFFDNAKGNITHVGLLLENHHIIHSSTSVRIDRIDQTGIFNLETQNHTHKLRYIKKMI